MQRKWIESLFGLALVSLVSAGCTAAEKTMAPLDEGDVVYSGAEPGEASNVERFEAFLAVTESGGADAVRIVNYTAEGHAIYTDISYAEGKYIIYVDNTEDPLAAGQERKKAAECAKLAPSDRPDSQKEYRCGTFAFTIENL